MDFLDPATTPNTGTVNGQNAYVDCGQGIAGTSVTAENLNQPLFEIVNAIMSAGITPDKGDLTQLATAIEAIANARAAAQIAALLAGPILKELILTCGISLFQQDAGGNLVIADGTDGNGSPTFTPCP